MRILFGIDTWGLVGGTERYAAVVVPALLERGHEVVVLCREAHESDFAAGIERVPVLVEPALEGTGMSKVDRRRLSDRARDLAPDVVFLQVARNLSALETLLDVAPVVRFVHDHTLFCPGLNKYTETDGPCSRPLGLECLRRYWLTSGCVCFKKAGHANVIVDPLTTLAATLREIDITKRAARLVTNSAYMAGELVQAGFDHHAVVPLPMFTRSGTTAQPAGELPAETAEFLKSSDAPLIFTPARLTLPDKGVDYLISALATMTHDFRCVIAGTGPAEEWLRTKAEQDGVGERVHFTGWLDQGGVEALFERCDIVACPSVWKEPFGLVGLEAMAHQKPIVGFRTGGIPEWLRDGDNGLLVDRCDVGAYAGALDRLTANPSLREELGAGGARILAEDFAEALHMDRLEGVLLAAASA